MKRHSHRTISIVKCARCGGSHPDMIFIPFSLPPKEYTHWALCPMAKELILFKQDKRGCPYCDNGIWAIILDGEGKEIAPPIACPVCGDK